MASTFQPTGGSALNDQYLQTLETLAQTQQEIQTEGLDSGLSGLSFGTKLSDDPAFTPPSFGTKLSDDPSFEAPRSTTFSLNVLLGTPEPIPTKERGLGAHLVRGLIGAFDAPAGFFGRDLGQTLGLGLTEAIKDEGFLGEGKILGRLGQPFRNLQSGIRQGADLLGFTQQDALNIQNIMRGDTKTFGDPLRLGENVLGESSAISKPFQERSLGQIIALGGDAALTLSSGFLAGGPLLIPKGLSTIRVLGALGLEAGIYTSAVSGLMAVGRHENPNQVVLQSTIGAGLGIGLGTGLGVIGIGVGRTPIALRGFLRRLRPSTGIRRLLPPSLQNISAEQVARLERILLRDGQEAVQREIDILARRVVEDLDTIIQESFERPEFETIVIREGSTVAESRASLETIGKFVAEISDAKLRIDELSEIAARSAKENVDNVAELAKKSKTELVEIAIPDAIARAETNLSRIVRSVDNIVERIARATPEGLDIAALLRGITGITDPQDFSSAAIRSIVDEASGIVEDFRLTSPIDQVDRLTEISDSLDDLINVADRVDTLQTRLLDDGAIITQELQSRSAERLTRELSAGRERVTRASRQETIKLENAIAENIAKIEEIRQSPAGRAARSGLVQALTPVERVSPRGVLITQEILSEVGALKDIIPFFGQLFTDPFRVAQAQQGARRGFLNRSILEPASNAITAATKDNTAFLNDFNSLLEPTDLKIMNFLEQASAGVGFSPKALQARERSRVLFKVADGTASRAQKASITPDEQALLNFAQAFYKEKLRLINEVRAKFNHAPIPERQDYITHIREFNLMDKLSIDVTNRKKLLTMRELDAKSSSRKTKPGFAFENPRTGAPNYEEDFVKALMSYAPGAHKQIHYTPVAAQVDAIISVEGFPPLARKFWKKWLDERFLGNKDSLDQFVDNWVDGVEISRLAGLYTQATSAGAIVGNFSTTALQPSTAGLTLARGGLRNFFQGTKKLLDPDSRRYAEANSNNIATRNPEFDQPQSGVIAKVNWLNSKIDREMVIHSWLTFFEQAKRMGYSEKASQRYAEHQTTRTQAIYDKAFAPSIVGGRTSRLLGGQFQTFGLNLFNSIVRDIPAIQRELGTKAAAAETVKVVAAMAATNMLYEVVGAPTPFGFLEGFDPTKPQDTRTRAKKIATFIPVIGGLAIFGPPIFIENVRNGWKFFTSDSEFVRNKAAEDLKKDQLLVFPFWNQIRKSSEGIKTVNQGYYELGKTRVPIEGLDEKLRAVIFGPSGTKAAADQFDEWDANRARR